MSVYGAGRYGKGTYGQGEVSDFELVLLPGRLTCVETRRDATGTEQQPTYAAAETVRVYVASEAAAHAYTGTEQRVDGGGVETVTNWTSVEQRADYTSVEVGN